MTKEAKKCGHQTCHCLVAEGKIYCGPWCEGAKSNIEAVACECGHPACQETTLEEE
jgi:hypothetical protein